MRWFPIICAFVASPVFANNDAESKPPALVGTREEASCRFQASDDFDDGPPPRSFDLKAMSQDVALYFGEVATEANTAAGKPLSGEAITQAIENEINSFPHHHQNYWRRRRSRLFDQRRTLVDATIKIFKTCSALASKTPEVTATCERLVKDRAEMEKVLAANATEPKKLDTLEKETHEAAVATKDATDLLANAVGQPFFELEKELKKAYDKFAAVSKARGAMDSKKEELQEKLTVAESELYRLEDEVHHNTEAQEDALEARIEQLNEAIARFNAGDDVTMEMAFLPPGYKDSQELRSIKVDKKVKEFVAKNSARYRSERAKFKVGTDDLEREAARVERMTKYDPLASFVGPRLATTMLERGDELPVAVSYVIEAPQGKPEIVSTSLLCGRRKRQEGMAFLVSFTPPKPPPPPKPAPPIKGKRAIATAPRKVAPWPAIQIQTRAASRAGLEEAIICSSWTLYCDKTIPVEEPEPPQTKE